jgi:hypothetical protein
MGSTIEIDWASAQVRAGRLSVALSRKPPGALGDVVSRLQRDGHPWGEVEVGKRRLHVSDVTPGAEAELRHFLESAVLQANADAGLAADEPDGDEPATTDDEMTAAFRAFART